MEQMKNTERKTNALSLYRLSVGADHFVNAMASGGGDSRWETPRTGSTLAYVLHAFLPYLNT
jgi:hypothetical protein